MKTITIAPVFKDIHSLMDMVNNLNEPIKIQGPKYTAILASEKYWQQRSHKNESHKKEIK